MEKWMMIRVKSVLMKTFKDLGVLDILQSVVGNYEPLIVT
jgi:hypothetical protein